MSPCDGCGRQLVAARDADVLGWPHDGETDDEYPARFTAHGRLVLVCSVRCAFEAGAKMGAELRAAAAAAAPEAERPRCTRCGQFLSATRVEMHIDRCSDCDRRPPVRR